MALTSLELLRRYTDEPTQDTFSDDLMNQVLSMVGGDIRSAASEIWLMKASDAKAQMGDGIESMSVGGESYSYVKFKEKYEYYLKMADRYSSASIVQQQEAIPFLPKVVKAAKPRWM